MTARDRKIIMAIVPLLIIVGYWFMILAPKRAESRTVTQELSKAQTARDAAEQEVAQLNAAKASFATDYETVIRLGKAVPTSVDMASLLVQLDRAARGTGIEIEDFKPVPTGLAGAPGASTPPGGGSNPAAPGSAPAQGFPAKQAQGAGKAVDQANKGEQANADKAAAVGAAPAAGAAASPPGLVAVPLTFTTTGDYFGLSDFLHRMKRFVRVVNDQIVVRGRLLTIEGFSFERPEPTSRLLKADVTATVYLTPPEEGTTAGATPAGPAGAASSGASTGATSTSSTPTPTPTASAMP